MAAMTRAHEPARAIVAKIFKRGIATVETVQNFIKRNRGGRDQLSPQTDGPIGGNSDAPVCASAKYRSGCRRRRCHRQQRRRSRRRGRRGRGGCGHGNRWWHSRGRTRPRFHEHVAHQHHPSYHYGDFRVGAILPPDGVTFYDIPGEYHVQGFRYAYVNDHAVLVDPRTRQIVEIVD
jgi:hypothetical protein